MTIYDDGVLVVKDAPTTPTGGAALEFGRRRFEDEPELDVDRVAELRDSLTDWLVARGRS